MELAPQVLPVADAQNMGYYGVTKVNVVGRAEKWVKGNAALAKTAVAMAHVRGRYVVCIRTWVYVCGITLELDTT